MSADAPMTFDDVVQRHVGTIVHRTHVRYGVDADDIRQELLLWMYGDGRARIERWLAAEPQQVVRLFYQLTSVAKTYAAGRALHDCRPSSGTAPSHTA